MYNSWWSWLLFANGAFGFWFYIRHPRVGAYYNIAGHILWFIYGFVTHQYGFVASALTYITIFSYSLWKGYNKHKKDEALVHHVITINAPPINKG